MSAELAIQLSLLIPLLGAVGIFLAGYWPNIREAITLSTAVILFLVVLSLYEGVAAGARPEVTLIEMFPGLPIKFVVEPLGMLFALIASGLWIVTSLYAIGYMRGNNEQNQTRFYICFAIAISATIGVAFSGNLLTLFIFYEVLTVSTYPLVTHSGKPEALKSGRTYLGILMSTSIAFLFVAIVWTWSATGKMDFTPGGILAGSLEGPELGILLFLYIFGIGKAAVMPVHRWLPAAMVAPTPVSALLHAVAVVKSGVFAVVKIIVYIFGIDLLAGTQPGELLVYVAGFTVLTASFVALRQDNLKRRLAYSTISQLSYVVIAAAILTPISLVGAAMHIAAHAFGKITLFFAAGSIYTAAHKTEVSQLDGIGRKMPWTMTAFAIGALSMIGLPPTAGFVSKWVIVEGAIQGGQWAALGVIVLSTLLNTAYLVPIVYRAFMVAPPKPQPVEEDSHEETADEEAESTHHDDHHDDHGEAPLPIVLALTITAVGTVLLFLFPEAALGLAEAMLGGVR